MQRNKIAFVLALAALAALLIPHDTQAAGLVSRVNEAFRGVHGRNPTVAENSYWATRTTDKRTFEALQDTMQFYQAQGATTGGATGKVNGTKTTAAAGNKNQLIKDVLPLAQSIFGKADSTTKAWWRKRISCGEIKTRTQLEGSMRFHHAKGVTKGRNTICGQKSTAPAGVTSKNVSGFSDHPLGDTVRIGIYNAGQGGTVTVTANGKYHVREGSTTRATVGKSDVVKISYSGGLYRVRGAANVDANEPIRLVPVGGTIMQVRSYNDKSSTIAGKNYNRFRDTIEVRKCNGCGEMWVINDVRAEHYAKGLAETLAKDPAANEYYKALATAARSYALYHRNVTGGRKPAQGYDIGRTADDQIYRGYEYEVLVPRLVRAVDATRGVIVTDKNGNDPLITTYFSDSGGKTKTAKQVWGTTASRFNHLQKAVNDPHHAAGSCRGHCVGLSAQGAFGFAKADGWSFDRILKYYYQNIRLVKAY